MPGEVENRVQVIEYWLNRQQFSNHVRAGSRPKNDPIPGTRNAFVGEVAMRNFLAGPALKGGRQGFIVPLHFFFKRLQHNKQSSPFNISAGIGGIHIFKFGNTSLSLRLYQVNMSSNFSYLSYI